MFQPDWAILVPQKRPLEAPCSLALSSLDIRAEGKVDDNQFGKMEKVVGPVCIVQHVCITGEGARLGGRSPSISCNHPFS